MSEKEKKSQGDILAAANETMRQLNDMLDNPEHYKLTKISSMKVQLKKKGKNPNTEYEDR